MNYLTKFPTVEDRLKLLIPAIGLLTLCLAAVSLKPTRGSDIYLLLVTIASFLLSLGLLVAKYFDWIRELETKRWRWLDAIFHGGLSGLLTIGWILCMVNIFALWSLITGGFMTARFFALIFLSMEIGLYGLIAWVKFKKIKGESAPHETVT